MTQVFFQYFGTDTEKQCVIFVFEIIGGLTYRSRVSWHPMREKSRVHVR